MIDTDMKRYVTDRKGNLLSLAEIREHFINDKKVVVYHNFDDPSSKISYYHAYMAKNTYWFCRWGDFGFYQEEKQVLKQSAAKKSPLMIPSSSGDNHKSQLCFNVP